MLVVLWKLLWYLYLTIIVFFAEFSHSEVSYEEGFVDLYDANSGAEKTSRDIIVALDLPFIFCNKCHNLRSGSGYNSGKYYAAAAAVAIHDINNNKNLLNGYRLRYIWNINHTDTHCVERDAINIMLGQLNMNVSGFIGFNCHCRTVSKIASAVNLPLFSMSCQEMDLSKKSDYPTFARTTTLNRDVIYMIIALLRKFKWEKFAVMYEKSHIWDAVYKALQKESEDLPDLEITTVQSYKKTDSFVLYYDSLEHIFEPFLNRLKTKARIVLLMLDKGKLQQFMMMASKKNMTNGDYVFIAVHPFATSETFLRNTHSLHNYVWILPWMGYHGEGEGKNAFFFGSKEEMVKAYQGLFVLMPQIPSVEGNKSSKFEDFQDRVRDGMEKPPFYSNVYKGVMKNVVKPKSKAKPPPEAHQLYDAVMLYAYGLNKTLSKGHSVTNGSDIIQNILNTRHESISGSPFIVNCKADVQVLFEVRQFQFNEEKLKLPEKEIFKPERVFVFESNDHSGKLDCSKPDAAEEQRFYLTSTSTDLPVQWLYGKPVRDTPPCGFDNLECNQEEISKGTILGLAISLTMLGVIVFVIPVFLYRNYHLKKELNLQLWKISAAELFYHDWSVSTSSLGSLTSQTGSLHYDMPSKQQFITTAYYKGTLVAVKKISKKSVELNKNILMELKQVRDVRNENLNQFIGACVEPNNVLVITSYASRGSLQDILENNDIELDAPFILSLVYDIIKGMLYLHSTDIKSHGNLKSSNCVIDSRWVLKISDFGLNTFRSRQGSISSLESEPLNNLLWKAPELLRIDIPPTYRGTQKGDVYSFGIILQECHTRDGAWGLYQDPDAIIEKVKMHLSPPFRPVVSELISRAEGLHDVMKKCWLENPEDRPYFSELRKDVEVMMKANGMRANLVENMILMLEKYSKSLEEIVEDRTTSLREEKHKVEALLERMLPKSVANQLMQGREVEAELFEEVSIYFSDIVGFTTICSSITPMEVVNLLNTLYTMFDNIAHDYDVYKVETIGDAYMVVSGLPIRNRKQHAKEISLMSLDILKHMKTFKIRPNQQQIKIRIGVHTGPVVAGVVGTTMPRYCLFGDTVNVAARMESTGEALRIQISEETKQTLAASVSNEEFLVEPRGFTDVKGKGSVQTYWLVGLREGYSSGQHSLLSRRDHSSLYRHDNSPSYTRILRDSPKNSRHKKLHVTPNGTDFSRTPPLNPPLSKEQRAKNYLKSHVLPMCKKRGKPTQVEITTEYGNIETQNLIRANAFSSPGVEYHNRADSRRSNDSPRPV